jgi:hypothetical protein
LRKKMLGGSDKPAAALTLQGAPETGPTRGSPKSPKSPRSPKSPKSLKLAPQPTGPGPANVNVSVSANANDADGGGQPGLPVSSATVAIKSFAPITTPIPDDGLWDDFGSLSFSNRGSLMFGGKSNPFKSP